MKSIMNIFFRYVLSAAGIALILLIMNFAMLIAWGIQTNKFVQKNYSVSQISDSLTLSNGTYHLSESAQKTMKKHFQWAMLLNNNGNIIWSENLPSDVPVQYTVSDAASFSRWYLNNYPVYVWQHSDGLFVLGSEKGSIWKYSIQMPQKVMDKTLKWIPIVFILNGLTAILLALLFALKLFHSLKPLAKGIEEMAENQPVKLTTHGLFGDLAAGINKTSAQLTKQEAALSKQDNTRTTWIAGISHDIRTPLSLVMGYASQLENDPELPSAKQEQARIIRRKSEQIKTLIHNLNLASKLEYDMQPFEKKEIALAPLVRSITADFLNSGLDLCYSIEVTIQENSQNITVIGDEDLLKRAISNLITNSIEHNIIGCNIYITLKNDLGNVSLTISDNGKGFTMETLDRLNYPLKTNSLQSHGLGLTIVRQILEAHGGTTDFHNLPEGGCIVTLCIPTNDS